LFKIGVFRIGEITDSLRIVSDCPEVRDRLRMLMMVGMRTEAHSFKSKIRIGSESDCLLRQFNRILEI